MANNFKQNERDLRENSTTKSKSVSFVDAIKYYALNFVGLIIIFPLIDLIISAISHKEFQYSAITHIASPAIWAIFLTIFDIIWVKNRKKNKYPPRNRVKLKYTS